MKETKILKPEIARVSSKGQVVIPQDIRKQAGIQAGSVIEFVSFDSLIVAKKIPVKLSKKEEKDLKDVAEAWKDIATGKFEIFSPEEFFKKQRKWISKR